MTYTTMTKAQLIAALVARDQTAPRTESRPLSVLRASGAFTCGANGKGHGKNADGNFATAKGLAAHNAWAHKA